MPRFQYLRPDLVPLAEAQRQIDAYRAAHPEILRAWEAAARARLAALAAEFQTAPAALATVRAVTQMRQQQGPHAAKRYALKHGATEQMWQAAVDFEIRRKSAAAPNIYRKGKTWVCSGGRARAVGDSPQQARALWQHQRAFLVRIQGGSHGTV